MNILYNISQKLILCWWCFIYNLKLGVVGIGITNKFFSKFTTPFFMRYNDLLNFLAYCLAIARLTYGTKDLYKNATCTYEGLKNKLNIHKASKDMLGHLMHILYYNDDNVFDIIKIGSNYYKRYYIRYYKEKLQNTYIKA